MTEPLYFRHPAALDHDTGSHPEGPGRIPAIERELTRRDWLGYRRIEAPEVEIPVLTRVHPVHYVDAIRRVAECGGGALDPDTVVSPGSYEAALRAAGSACALVEELIGRGGGVGFSGMRPPGHHAEPERAMGFCLFNNVAVAARYALDVLGVRRVLVFDWDVHHGNGTNDIFQSSPEVLYASIHQWPLYPGTGPLRDVGSGPGEGYTLNFPVPPGSEEDLWLSLVAHVLVPVARRFEPELVLVSAGFDAHRDDPLASCRLEEGSFATMSRCIRSLADELGAPLALVLEGGYDLRALAASVCATLEAVAAGGPAPVVAEHAVVERMRASVGQYWQLA